MSSKRLDSIADYHRHHYRLQVDCRACGRVVILEPLELLERCREKGWSYQLEAVQARLVCAECGLRDVRCGPAFGKLAVRNESTGPALLPCGRFSSSPAALRGPPLADHGGGPFWRD